MSASINSKGVAHARSLAKSGKIDKGDSWNAPNASKENSYIEKHGISEYGKWFLGVHSEHSADQKDHYGFPFSSNFETVSRKGIIACKSRAAQAGYSSIEAAADRILKIIDGDKETSGKITAEDFGGLSIKFQK